MKVIRKGKAPRSLTEHRADPTGTSYESFPHKQDLREALAAEQGYLCCYCMARIRADERHMKIEHWASQETHPEKQLAYSNMLGACLGNMGAPPDAQHCDTYKGSRKGPGDIKLNPTDTKSGWERAIYYSRADGRIGSTNPLHDRELDSGGLNLNVDHLKEERLAAWSGVKEALSRKHRDAWPRAEIQRYIEAYESLDEHGRYKPYCAVVVYFLRKRLSR